MATLQIRAAQSSDISKLVELEKQSFQTDQISRRSFAHFIRQAHCSLLIAEQDGVLAGYGLLLYRKGTQLARLYSIAVSQDFRGQGVARQLLAKLEKEAKSQFCIFLRLEVHVDNKAAIALYQSLGYRQVGKVKGYYGDGGDALRLEKAIHLHTMPGLHTRRFEQTTDFTCGPASLMMAMHKVDANYKMTASEELQIWREATTIFMTSGHGGCSGIGLALSAWRRGYAVTLYVNQQQAPFLRSVRDANKKTVIERVHDDFMAQAAGTDIEICYQAIDHNQLKQVTENGGAMVSLISTWRLNRNKAPHWVYITAYDEHSVAVTDPEYEREPWQSEMDFTDVPVANGAFLGMTQFGRERHSALLVIRKRS